MIPLNSPHLDNLAIRRKLMKAIRKVVDSDRYILGEYVENFERSFASKFGAKACVGVANGTDAISMALRAFDIGTNDEVITVGNTALATIAGIIAVGAKPVIVDVNKETGLISEQSILEALSPTTRAIVLVHLFGSPVDVESIKSFLPVDIKIIEDCAQAHGAEINGRPVGTIGDIGCFSFYPTKILGAIGDGGCVISNDIALIEKVRRLREYGWDKNRIANSEIGINSRLDEMQAALLQVKLETFDSNFSHRSKVADFYKENLKTSILTLLNENPKGKHAYHLFVGVVENRNEFVDYMNNFKQIEVGVHYRTTILDHQAYLPKVRITNSGIENTVHLAKNIVSLPMNNYIKIKELRQICDAINQWGRS